MIGLVGNDLCSSLDKILAVALDLQIDWIQLQCQSGSRDLAADLLTFGNLDLVVQVNKALGRFKRAFSSRGKFTDEKNKFSGSLCCRGFEGAYRRLQKATFGNFSFVYIKVESLQIASDADVVPSQSNDSSMTVKLCVSIWLKNAVEREKRPERSLRNFKIVGSYIPSNYIACFNIDDITITTLVGLRSYEYDDLINNTLCHILYGR